MTLYPPQNKNADSLLQIQEIFPIIPIWKIILLSILTSGMYHFVWFYRYFKIINCCSNKNSETPVNSCGKSIKNTKNKSKIQAALCIFTSFYLFSKLQKYLQKYYEPAFPPVIFSISYIFFSILWFVGYLRYIAYLGVIPIIIIQYKINKLNKKHHSIAKKYGWTSKTTTNLLFFLIISHAIIIFIASILVIGWLDARFG